MLGTHALGARGSGHGGKAPPLARITESIYEGNCHNPSRLLRLFSAMPRLARGFCCLETPTDAVRNATGDKLWAACGYDSARTLKLSGVRIRLHGQSQIAYTLEL
jgi:hypothetical protein